MLPKTADRFAEVSLLLYGQEESFATEIEPEEDLEIVAEAFERRGCVVQREPLRHRVVVTAPKV